MKLFILIFILLCSGSAFGIKDIETTLKKGEPVMFMADSLEYNNKKSTVIAKGNAEFHSGGKSLLADTFIYNTKENIINAHGNVVLSDTVGNVFFTDQLEIKGDLKEAVIKELYARMADNSKIAAKGAHYVEGQKTVLKRAVFSPCHVCKKHKVPLWQIKAKKIEMDEREEMVTYSNAHFEALGVPIFYTPYFFHPTPDAKRKSGILRPTLGLSSDLGAKITIPYYLNIAPNMDATFSPTFITEGYPVFASEFRHLTEYGQYELSGSFTYHEKYGRNDKTLRGHLEGFGDFRLDDDWRIGFKGKRVTDDTYLRKFDFKHEDILTSKLYANFIRPHTYFGAETLSFQNLTKDSSSSDTIPLVLPMLDFSHKTEPLWWNSYMNLDANALSIFRNDGLNVRRVFSEVGWTLPYKTSSGHLFELATHLSASAYSVTDSKTDKTENDTRIIPDITLQWRYPLMKEFDDTNFLIIEPIIQAIFAPNTSYSDIIPNEDSLGLDFSDANLFTRNRYTGIDRVETGTRFNYGMRGDTTLNNDHFIDFLLGQSYRIRRDPYYPIESGLGDNFSDFIGRIAYKYSDNFNLSYRFRMDKDNFQTNRSELGSGFRYKDLTLGLNYVLADEEAGRDEEIFLSSGLKFDENWSMEAYLRKDLDLDHMVENGGKLTYGNECLEFSTIFRREYTEDREIEDSTSISFELKLKGLN